MRGLFLIVGMMFALTTMAHAQRGMPPEKQAELQAKGILNWTPGQNRGNGPPFALLPQPQSVTAQQNPDGTTRVTKANTDTMQYDNGTLSSLPTTFGQVYGNRFSLGVGGVQLDAITLNSFSFYFMEDSLPDTGLFFQAADPLNTMSINARDSINIAGLMNSGPSFMTPVLNVIPQAGLMTTGMFNDTFFLGAWCLNSNMAFPVNNEVIGLATNGPRQQGYTAASGNGAVAFAAQPFNAIIRANITSPNTVPVELMNFDVE